MVVIVGAGMAGIATAYYLCKLGTPDLASQVTIVDAVGPAACSSGTAGAYLSSHWGDGTKRESLFRKSFALHQELAHDLSLQSFQCISSFRVNLSPDDNVGTPRINEPPAASDHNWKHRVSSFQSLAGSSATVDPKESIGAMMDNVLEQGASFMIESVNGFGTDAEKRRVTGMAFESGNALDVGDSEHVVIALGPWTSRIEDWFDTPLPIEGVLSTSLIWENAKKGKFSDIDAALFCHEDSNGCHLEILPRMDGSLYVSGCGESQVLSPQIFRSPQRPEPQDACPPSMARATAAQKSLQSLGSHFPSNESDGVPDKVMACIRPAAPDDMPIVGKLGKLENVYVATGGGPWGITWGPLMGKCMASLLLNESSQAPVRLSSLSPNRFDTLLYRTFLQQRRTISTTDST